MKVEEEKECIMLLKYTCLSAVFYLAFIGLNIRAQNISVIGNWSETIQASDLQSGAGSDLIDTYESLPDQIEVAITGAANKTWRIDVSKVDNLWDSRFQLFVKRTSDGLGSGSVTGGTSYQEVTNTEQSFFNGYKNCSNIYLQLKASGISIQIPPNTYSTTVYYTVIDTS